MSLAKVVLLHLWVEVVRDIVALWLCDAVVVGGPLDLVEVCGVLEVAGAVQRDVDVVAEDVGVDIVRQVVWPGQPQPVRVRRIYLHGGEGSLARGVTAPCCNRVLICARGGLMRRGQWRRDLERVGEDDIYSPVPVLRLAVTGGLCLSIKNPAFSGSEGESL
ncbi:hypothetical protein Micbo1qcDRAFT_157746 [Microdochium bolleyi]|uniref:Secreted protein n=1 Tax=Microdochium bolleyi TaxID=196109 RepID=A0A136JEY7_9PEZI|nr:hypothetical protein Micbo1qcDRAFT_157746 [Microdochium bolleyi]